MGLTASRNTARKKSVWRKNWQILIVSREKG